jgi:hypothetical protein
VIVRPLGASIRAGLSPRASAWASTYSARGTFGMATSGYGLEMMVMGYSPSGGLRRAANYR